MRKCCTPIFHPKSRRFTIIKANIPILNIHSTVNVRNRYVQARNATKAARKERKNTALPKSLITFPTEIFKEKYRIIEMRMILMTTIVFLDSFFAFVSFVINDTTLAKMFPLFKNPSPSHFIFKSQTLSRLSYTFF